MRIIFFGCDVSLSIFETLINLGHRIDALYTFHNPYDRVHEDKIVARARSLGIEVNYSKMTLTGAEALFESNDCDLLVSAEYYYKIPTPGTKGFKGVNVHNSLLPEGRGFFSVETRKYLGLPYGGVTFHKLSGEFDEGDIIMQKRFELDDTDDVRGIYRKCAEASVEMCKKVFESDESFIKYWARAVPQKGEASIWHPGKEERAIHPDMTIEQALRLFSCYDRFTYAHPAQDPRSGGLRRVLDISADAAPLSDEYLPYRLKNGTLWMVLE